VAITLASLLPDTLARVEENEESGPVFWSQTYEILPALVDSMFEAALITGTVQAINVPVTLAANTTFFSLQNNTAIGIPAGVIAALRLRLPWPIRKTTLKGLSDVIPGWQNTAAATSLRAWFPLGVSQFGIFPQLTSPQTAIIDFILAPTTAARPYTTGIVVPFQEEFTSAFSEYAAVMLRAKELGAEAEESSAVLNEYLQQMKELSMFQGRLDSLVLTNTYGARATVNKREIV
jgi:hypothetical protein